MHCPVCGTDKPIKARSVAARGQWIKLVCGHGFVHKADQPANPTSKTPEPAPLMIRPCMAIVKAPTQAITARPCMSIVLWQPPQKNFVQVHLDLIIAQGKALEEEKLRAVAEVKNNVIEFAKPVECEVFDMVSRDGKTLYPFQMRGVKFIEDAMKNPHVKGCLIEDEPGLGKTVQGLGYIKRNLDDVGPILYICKATLLAQVHAEAVRWVGANINGKWIPSMSVQILRSSKEKPHFDIFDMFVVSYDLLWRMPWIKDKESIPFFKTVIIDEVQQIKNPDSKRAWGVRRVCEKAEHVLELSGTPVKNRGTEFFVALNILSKTLFPTESHFIYNHVDFYRDKTNRNKIKTGGLKDPVHFRKLTSHFILRRTRTEVNPELSKAFPGLNRKFRFVGDLGEKVEEAYRRTMADYVNAFDGTGSFSGQSASQRRGNILGFMSKMRHLTGLAKIEPVYDYTEEFLEGRDDAKLILFVHHKDVGQALFFKIRNLCIERGWPLPVQLVSEQPADVRGRIAYEFNNDPNIRVLVASTLSAGEGLNLQSCSDLVMVERQWNPPNEEQAEGRCLRLGRKNDAPEFVNADYFIAEGTIDELLTDITEEKRLNNGTVMLSSDMTDEEIDELRDKAERGESDVMRELMERLRTKGARRWKVA